MIDFIMNVQLQTGALCYISEYTTSADISINSMWRQSDKLGDLVYQYKRVKEAVSMILKKYGNRVTYLQYSFLTETEYGKHYTKIRVFITVKK